MNYKPEWGFHNLMVLAAFRYCLGRQSYIVGSCVDWLIQWWEEIDRHTKKLILEEIRHAVDHDIAGTQCDIDDWKRILALE